jgi:hypothetical protein
MLQVQGLFLVLDESNLVHGTSSHQIGLRPANTLATVQSSYTRTEALRHFRCGTPLYRP